VLEDRFVEFSKVDQVFGTGTKTYHALSDVDLRIAKGQFVSIIGHSGCGKSTLLNLVAGLSKPTSGSTLVGGRHVMGPGLDRAVVFQQHALLPWLSVEDNVRLGIDSRFPDQDKSWRTERARHYVEMVGLAPHARKKPSEISGGMKQRAGIARAFAVDPEVLLLDEQFGALDALTRGIMQDELIRLWESDRKTVIMITHDVDEAVYLSDRIVLMTNGPRATIHEVLDVPMARPRDRETLLDDADYVRVRKELVHYLTATRHREAA